MIKFNWEDENEKIIDQIEGHKEKILEGIIWEWMVRFLSITGQNYSNQK